MENIEKILLVLDGFKNSLSAEDVTTELASGFNFFKNKLEIEEFPFADGGEGSLEVIKKFKQTTERTCYTFDPFMKPIRASYLLDETGTVAYIESAKVIGLEILERDPDCLYATSYGLGILIADALDKGVEEIYLFLGGSATCDGGYGMADALGYLFVKGRRSFERPLAVDILEIEKIQRDYVHDKLSSCLFHIACDVTNPLYGEDGTAKVYAKQKGASADQVSILEETMVKFADLIERDKQVDIQSVVGSGAAGGLGAGGLYFLDGKLTSAFEILSKISGLEESVKTADLIITGEGHIDMQSFHGKLISQLKIVADKYDKKVALICAIRSISQKQALRLGYVDIKSLYVSSPKEISIPDTRNKLFAIGKKWSKEIIKANQDGS